MRLLDILVVDDERDLASGVADVLETGGHRVTLAYDAETALELAQAQGFDMVLLDVKLPELSGVDILLPLRRALPGKMIVPMTGYRIDSLIATVVGGDNFMVLSAPESEDRVSAKLHGLGPGGMLVVLDSTGLLGAQLADHLGERGEAVCLARAEAEALEAGPFSGSDVLVLDLGRTVARGLEAYVAVREDGSNPKTIIIARIPGNGEKPVNPLRSVSVAGCLFKPFDPAELLEMVSDLARDSAPPPSPQPPLRTAR